MMKMSKLLININNLDEMKKYEEIGITNFLFAVEKFSIGYKTFDIDSIPDNVYILINRVMDTAAIDEFKTIVDKLDRFKGVIFEDIGVFNILKDKDLELIWFQNHFTTNYNSINFWLNNGCTSAVISNEITKEEINKIITSATKPLVLNVLGKNQIMYSRRTLLSNFNKYNNLEDNKDMILNETHTKNVFNAKETEYGTVIYNNEYFNYTKLMNNIDDGKIKFYMILNLDLSIDEIKEILDGREFGNDGFLNKKTVYRMSEYTDRSDK